MAKVEMVKRLRDKTLALALASTLPSWATLGLSHSLCLSQLPHLLNKNNSTSLVCCAEICFLKANTIL